MSVETKDFIDIVLPVLKAGTYSNFGSSPPIVVIGDSGPDKKSVRHNKNYRIALKNAEGSSDNTELTFNGTPIVSNLSGEIRIKHTDKQKRNYMKTDILAILKAGGITFSPPRLTNAPTKRNKYDATYFLQILDC